MPLHLTLAQLVISKIALTPEANAYSSQRTIIISFLTINKEELSDEAEADFLCVPRYPENKIIIGWCSGRGGEG